MRRHIAHSKQFTCLLGCYSLGRDFFFFRVMASDNESENAVDLAVILAPLSKEQLEFLVAKLVANHEELGEEV